MVFQWLLSKNFVKHNIFNTFGSQIPLQIMKNLRKTMVVQWLLSKTIVKQNVFATFGLQNLSPKPLQNRSKIEILKS